jgi:ParB family chromosome partitioning protein
MTKIRLSDYHRGTVLKAGYEPLRTVGEIDPGSIMAPLDRAPREHSDESIRHLGEDIKARGQLQPIRVYWSSLHSKWVIIAGERRWLAVQAAGLWKVAAIFLEHEPSAAEILSERLADNLLREIPEPMVTARGFRALMDLKNWSVIEVADHLHVHRGTVYRALALLDLPGDVQQHIESGKLAPATAYELSKVTDPVIQRQLVEQAITETLTRAETVSLAKATGKTTSKPATKHADTTKRVIHTEDGITITMTAKRRIDDAAAVVALNAAATLLARRDERGAA